MSKSNLTLFQFFHWYYSAEGNLWQHAEASAADLHALGVTHVWLPPAYKSALGITEPGYAVYDLYDLGEFDQKGTVRTRYGTREEYQRAITTFHRHGVQVLADIVLNHKHGGDENERIRIRRVQENNRQEFKDEPEEIDYPTKFYFPGRAGNYSAFEWNQHCFTGIELENGIGLVLNEFSNSSWEKLVEEEKGNFDFLMGNDIEYRNPFVREELKKWGAWYVETCKIDGFRLDALKHINPGFFPDWLDFLDRKFSKRFLCIGEYWQNKLAPLLQYIDLTAGRIRLFDVPLHHNFFEAAQQREGYDLRTIFDKTLTQARPDMAISFVDNHDTQPLQKLESTVEYWFQPHAYALILLREQGTPCVFFPALYGADYNDQQNGQDVHIELHKIPVIEILMKVRSKHAYGLQRDYFDDANIVGWTREGDPVQSGSGVAVLLSNAAAGKKKMSLGACNAYRRWKDVCGGCKEIITLDGNGEAEFPVHQQFISLWIDEGIHDY